MYHSQDGQDSILCQFFDIKGVTKGFFLDVGSVDGIHFSNTYMLEQKGWEGICVEAHPSYYPFLKENRKGPCYSFAAGDKDTDSCVFSSNYRGSLSTLNLEKESYYENSGYKPWYGDRNKSEISGIVNGRINIPMRKLDSILEENHLNSRNIDLITIDVDGSEIYTLPGLTLKKWNPTVLILEYTVVEDVVFNYARDNGYTFAMKCGADAIFCKTPEDADIMKQLRPIGKKSNRKHPAELYFNAGRIN